MPLLLRKSMDNGVTYSDPSDPGLGVRFKHTMTKKSLNGVQAGNIRTEIIVTDDNQVSISGVDANDAVSVRIHVSSAYESSDRVKQILSGLVGTLMTWESEHVFAGFNPSTAPDFPPVV